TTAKRGASMGRISLLLVQRSLIGPPPFLRVSGDFPRQGDHPHPESAQRCLMLFQPWRQQDRAHRIGGGSLPDSTVSPRVPGAVFQRPAPRSPEPACKGILPPRSAPVGSA